VFFFLDGDGLFLEEEFLGLELLDFVFDAVGTVEVFALYAEGFVGFEQVDHFGDFFPVEVLLVFEFAQPFHDGGVAHDFAFAHSHVR
jgi:hypothetical protein